MRLEDLELFHKTYNQIKSLLRTIEERKPRLALFTKEEILEMMKDGNDAFTEIFATILVGNEPIFTKIHAKPFYSRKESEWATMKQLHDIEALYNTTKGYSKLIETNGHLIAKKDKSVLIEVWIQQIKHILLNMKYSMINRYINRKKR